MAEIVLNNEADIVLGVRPSLPRLGEKIIARGVGISDATTGFRVLRQHLFKLLINDTAYGGMFIFRARKYGYKIKEYPININPRNTGKSFHSNYKVFLKSLNFIFWCYKRE